MSRRLKELVTKELANKFRNTKSCILLEYRKLSAGQMDQVRKAFAQRQARLQVVKNSLASLAFEQVGMGGLKPFLEGPTAVAYGPPDPAVLAKTVTECSKGFDGIQIKAGFGDGMIYDAGQVKALALIPPRETLYAKMLAGIQGPMVSVGAAFGAIQRSLACALRAIKEKKEKEAPPAQSAAQAPASGPAAGPAPAPEKPVGQA